MADEFKNQRFYLLEGQILHQIKKQEARLDKLKEMYNAEPKEITEEGYWAAFYSCHGAITQLTICLTAHDNPLSNFLSEKRLGNSKKKA